MNLNSKLNSIRISGHVGTWYIVDSFGHRAFPFTTLFVLESELYGDDAAHIIVDGQGHLILSEVWDTADIWNDGYAEIEKYYTDGGYQNALQYDEIKINGNHWPRIG